MRAAAAAELRAQQKPQRKQRRSGQLRGTDAAKIHGVSSAWDPERAAQRASERSNMGSGLDGSAGGRRGGGQQCEHPNESYRDMRYRSYDTVCPVCRGEVPPSIALGGNRQINEHPTFPCKTPDEATSDARYRKGDTVCPVCHGWLPRKQTAGDKNDDERGKEKDTIRVWGQPERWRRAAKGEVWRKQGLHVGYKRATLYQRSEQETVPHLETNAAQQCELGCKLEKEGDDVTRPDRQADLQKAAGWFRAAAFQGHPKALFRLGLCYLNAKGVSKDLRQGVAFLRKAAFQEADAAYELGYCYYNGVGEPKDENMALGWWRIALGMGHLKALTAINQSSESSGAKAERGRTARLQYRASHGDMEAQYQVASRLFQGNTVIKDEAMAAHYYQLAASQGHAEAMCAIGLCKYFGRGAKVDQPAAVQW